MLDVIQELNTLCVGWVSAVSRSPASVPSLKFLIVEKSKAMKPSVLFKVSPVSCKEPAEAKLCQEVPCHIQTRVTVHASGIALRFRVNKS